MTTGTRERGTGRAPMPLRRSRLDLNERPFIVIWEATRACDLACKHCRAEAVPGRDPRELSSAGAMDLMDQVMALGTPPPIFVITGGDPFKRDDLFELVAHGSSIGLPMAVSPSGTENLRRDNLLRLREAGARAISLSVDGADAGTHDAFRGVPGSFEHTLRGWDIAQDVGLKVQVNTTVTPGNLSQLADLLVLIRDRGVLTWSMFFLVPTGRGDGLAQLSPRQAEDALNFCYDADKIVSLKTTEAPHFRRVCVQRQILADRGLDHVAELALGDDYLTLSARLAELLPGEDGSKQIRRPPAEVSAARGFVFISHTGEVYPSGFLPLAAGDIHSQGLGEIYRDSELFRTIRDPDSLPGRCGRCEFRVVCGGSRPRAYGATGDLLADEPLCDYEPGSFPFQDDIRKYLK